MRYGFMLLLPPLSTPTSSGYQASHFVFIASVWRKRELCLHLETRGIIDRHTLSPGSTSASLYIRSNIKISYRINYSTTTTLRSTLIHWQSEGTFHNQCDGRRCLGCCRNCMTRHIISMQCVWEDYIVSQVKWGERHATIECIEWVRKLCRVLSSGELYI